MGRISREINSVEETKRCQKLLIAANGYPVFRNCVIKMLAGKYKNVYVNHEKDRQTDRQTDRDRHSETHTQKSHK